MAIFIFMFLLGIFMIIQGIYKIDKYKKLKQNNDKTIGTIVDLEIYKDYVRGVENVSYWPIIAYSINNVSYRIKATRGTAFKSKANSLLGQKVELYYDSNNPQKAVEIGSFQGISYLVIGLICSGISLAIILYALFLL